MRAGICEARELVGIRQIEKLLKKRGRIFLVRIFSLRERRYCASKAKPYEHYAVRYAAKTALNRLLGLKGNRHFRFFEITHFAGGKPHFRIPAAFQKKIGLNPKTRIEVSLAHEREHAAASVILIS